MCTRLMCIVTLWCVVLGRVFTCHTFNNTQVSAITNEGRHISVNVNGCIEREAFKREKVFEINIAKQDVPILMKDSIRHMTQLRSLTISNCILAKIQPATFRNVPRLETISFFQTRLYEVPKGFFNDTPALKEISLHHNRIDFIEDNSFAFLDNLKSLNLSYNRLEQINRNWFFELPSMTSLDLQHNSIKTIPRKAFTHLKNLTHISLDYNAISHIQQLAFEGLKDVEYLGLKHNRLSTLGYRSFPDGMAVEVLVIDANKLNFLPGKLVRKLKAVAPDGNPWTCPCMQEMSRRLKIVHSVECGSSYIPVCIQPKVETSECVESEDDEVRSIFYKHVGQYRNKSEGRCVQYD